MGGDHIDYAQVLITGGLKELEHSQSSKEHATQYTGLQTRACCCPSPLAVIRRDLPYVGPWHRLPHLPPAQEGQELGQRCGAAHVSFRLKGVMLEPVTCSIMEQEQYRRPAYRLKIAG